MSKINILKIINGILTIVNVPIYMAVGVTKIREVKRIVSLNKIR